MALVKSAGDREVVRGSELEQTGERLFVLGLYVLSAGTTKRFISLRQIVLALARPASNGRVALGSSQLPLLNRFAGTDIDDF